MTCARCTGLMTVVDCFDEYGTGTTTWVRVLKCILCGNMTDPIIEQHRHGEIPELPYFPNRQRCPQPRKQALKFGKINL